MFGKLLAIILFGLIGLVLLGAMVGGPREPTSAELCGPAGRDAAFYYGQRIVAKQLVAPSTADFVRYGSDGTLASHLGGCRFDIVGKVDAENSFGAKLRKTYTMVIEYQPAGDRWLASELVID